MNTRHNCTQSSFCCCCFLFHALSFSFFLLVRIRCSCVFFLDRFSFPFLLPLPLLFLHHLQDCFIWVFPCRLTNSFFFWSLNVQHKSTTAIFSIPIEIVFRIFRTRRAPRTRSPIVSSIDDSLIRVRTQSAPIPIWTYDTPSQPG